MWPAVPRTSLAPSGASEAVPAVGLAGSNAVEARVGAQRRGDLHRAVGSLVVLEQGDQRARGRHRRSVQRVDELVALRVGPPEADPQPARLVVGAVRGTRDLAPLARVAATGHPGLEVVLAPGGSP